MELLRGHPRFSPECARQRVAAKWLRHWLQRLVRVEVDFDGDRIRFYRLRSKELESQPLIKVRMPRLSAWLTASTGGRTNVVALGERLAQARGQCLGA